MSLLSILLAAEAAGRQSAVRRTAYCHRMLAAAPFVIAVYNLPGEAAAPLAFYYGVGAESGKLVVAAEPRNREVRFSAINEFCADFVRYVGQFMVLEERTVSSRGVHYTLKVTTASPQIVTPNRGSREFLGARLGRSLRYLGLGKTHAVPIETVWAGAHLSWLSDYVRMPGQSIFLAATELLARHYATGQSSLEDENLATLLAWIQNEPRSGSDKIRAAEQSSAAFGPISDPALDALLEPHVQAYGRAVRAGDVAAATRHQVHIARLVRAPLEQAYRATHFALDLLRKIPYAASAGDRAQRDVREWSTHVRRCEKGLPRFSKRHDALRAARLLETWSRAEEELEIDEAFDDPLVMAEHDADGLCVSGLVTSVDTDHYEVKPGKTRATLVPLITLVSAVLPQLLAGDEVWWTFDRRVRSEIRQVTQRRGQWSIELAVMEGHVGGSRLPATGRQTMFVALSSFGGMPPDGPKEVPWTHRRSLANEPNTDEDRASDAEAPSAADVAAANSEDEVGPDLTPDQTGAAPAADRADGDPPGVLV